MPLIPRHTTSGKLGVKEHDQYHHSWQGYWQKKTPAQEALDAAAHDHWHDVVGGGDSEFPVAEVVYLPEETEATAPPPQAPTDDMSADASKGLPQLDLGGFSPVPIKMISPHVVAQSAIRPPGGFTLESEVVEATTPPRSTVSKLLVPSLPSSPQP